MSLLRLTLSLAIAASCSATMAEQITCESHGNRADACGTLQPGSTVRLVRQLSNSPCIEGRSWSAEGDSLWVSNGCRAVFDVQPPYDASANRGYDGHGHRDERNQRDYRDQDRQQPQYSDQGDEPQNDDYSRRDDHDRSNESYRSNEDRGGDRGQEGHHSGRGEQRRSQARQACANAASGERGFAAEEVQTNDIRWIGEGRLSLSLDTPDGPLTCIVDRDGNVTLNDDR